jgi:HPt (histidine-containing phosphotransfer) domain-containing protein
MPLPSAPNDAIAELASGLGEDDARELVSMFLKSFDPTIAALSSDDHDEQRRAAHSLKSSSRIVGLLALSRQMAALEERLFQKGGSVTQADIDGARELFSEAAPILTAYAAARAGSN